MPSSAESASRRSANRARGSDSSSRARPRRAARSLAAGAHAAPLRARLDHVALLLEDEHVVAVVDDVLHPESTSARSCSAGSRGSASARARASSGSISWSQIALQQLLLAAEVVVEAAGGEAERLRELGHRGLVVAALGEHAGGAEHDLGAAAVVALAQGGRGGAGAPGRAFESIIRNSNAHSVHCAPHGLRPLRPPRADPAHRPRLRLGEVKPVAEELDREKRFPYEIVAKLGELG